MLANYEFTLIPPPGTVSSLTQLVQKVTTSDKGIGFTYFAHTGNAQVIDFKVSGDYLLPPTDLSLKTEEYPLTQRIYCYLLSKQENANVLEFVRFILSDYGQECVQQAGFIDLHLLPPATLTSYSPPLSNTIYSTHIAGAQKLPLNFRFEKNEYGLFPDTRASVDLTRLLTFLEQHYVSQDLKFTLLLIGHAHTPMGEDYNRTVANQLLTSIQSQLLQRGIYTRTLNMSHALSLGPSATEWGQNHNRRVEVWLKEELHKK
jgi:phosphate transport system substrate-binding protein